MTDLSKFYATRNTTPGDLITKLNPFRFKAHGYGNNTIGSDPAVTGPFHVFFTRPDCNLSTDAARNRLGIGTPMVSNGIADLLMNGGGGGLNKMLSNLVEGYDIPDMVLDTTAVGETWVGAKMQIGKSTLNSIQDGTATFEFLEYSGLPVTQLNNLHVQYIEAVTRGHLNPKYNSPNYINQRILDYAISIYLFMCAPDGITIEFGARLTGVYPIGVPYSSFPGRKGPSEAIKVRVPFYYSYMEAMNPSIFNEFTAVAQSSGVSIREVLLQNTQRHAYQLQFTEGLTPWGRNTPAVGSGQGPAGSPTGQ